MTELLAAPAWWDLSTAAGRFTLCPVKADRDLPLIHKWMNDPDVARYWELQGPVELTAAHLAEQRALTYSEPYLARLSGRPIGYWELYRAAEDRLAAYYPAQADDVGVHLLIGEPSLRGVGLGATLLTALCDAIQGESRRRIVAEPDERNVASVRAFLAAGFRVAGTIRLPEKRATLVIRDLPTRDVPTRDVRIRTVPA
ncbi:MAG TPA: GNAT family N-acetyltransferase [Actinocrinis sp.]|nr:GNAT family N-acetyltransferase [Actinospica sp.]HEU5426531.1 GNAT family N-acetyltransferase [Actinocrinis sp.]